MEASQALSRHAPDQRVRIVFVGAFIAFVGGVFVIPSFQLWTGLFYALVIPSGFYLTFRTPKPLRAAALLGLILIAWHGVSLLWAEPPDGRLLKITRHVAFTATFFYMATRFFGDERNLRRFVDAFIVAALVGAVWTLGVFVFATLDSHGLSPAAYRISGVGQLYVNPADASHVFAVAALIAAAGSIVGLSRLPGWVRWTCALACFATIFLSQTRGVLLAAAAAAALLAARRLGLRRALLIGVALLVASVVVDRAIAFGGYPSPLEYMIARGDSHRLEVWSFAAGRIAEAPLLGHGLGTPFGLPIPLHHPHNQYLAVLFVGGAVGGALLLAFAAALIANLRRAAAEPAALAAVLLFYVALVGAIDFGRLIEGPRPLWIGTWLPLALAAGLPRAAQTATPRM